MHRQIPETCYTRSLQGNFLAHWIRCLGMLARLACMSWLLRFNSEDVQKMPPTTARNVPCALERGVDACSQGQHVLDVVFQQRGCPELSTDDCKERSFRTGVEACSQGQHVCPCCCVSTARISRHPCAWMLRHAHKASLCVFAVAFQQRRCPEHGTDDCKEYSLHTGVEACSQSQHVCLRCCVSRARMSRNGTDNCKERSLRAQERGVWAWLQGCVSTSMIVPVTVCRGERSRSVMACLQGQNDTIFSRG